jgi:hypothetical protein
MYPPLPLICRVQSSSWRPVVLVLVVLLCWAPVASGAGRGGNAPAPEELVDGGEPPATTTWDVQQPAANALPLSSALEVARALRPPEPSAVSGGEAEHADWWDLHEDVLRRAREEYGQRHPELYRWTPAFLEAFVDPRLREAFGTKNVTMLRELVRPTSVDNVFSFQLFTPAFVKQFVEELNSHDASGIPRRRPNGMNRYGAALHELGFDDAMQGLVRDLLSPLARTLFPRYVGPSDVTHHYPFTVRYRPDEDVELNEHADASVVTVNVCLEPAADERVLYFKEHRTLQHKKTEPFSPRAQHGSNGTSPTFVDLSQPGQAVLHLGQIVHGVGPIVASRRSNLVVWLFAEHGDVRIAEYSDSETARHEREMGAFWGLDDDPLRDEP